MIGQRISHFQIVQELGKGGMGEVYLAQDTVLERKVAIKFLPEELSRDEEARRRFLREAQSAAALDHPYICKIYEIGQVDGRDFIAMEYVPGQTLGDFLKDGYLRPVQALELAVQISEAMEEAHQNGVVHRDLKPANIMITEQGYVKVMDFGLAKQSAVGEDDSADMVTQTNLTKAGTVMGTVAYMSPEQAKGEVVDSRSDLFALGILFFEMLTGQHPFRRETGIETLTAILQDPLPPLPKQQVKSPEGFQHILAKALAKDPAERYQDFATFTKDLKALRAKVTAKPIPLPLLIAAGIAVIVLVTVSGLWLFRGSAIPPEERDPVSVLIADFRNQTGDEVFEGSVEQALGVGLEAAPFVRNYKRRDAMRALSQIREGATRLDTEGARLVARRQSLNVVISGGIEADGDGYKIPVEAIDVGSGDTIYSDEIVVSNQDEVLEKVGRLALAIRSALGDIPPESLQEVAAETFTAASLQAAHSYARAQDLQNEGKFAEALSTYQQAVALDPQMGRAYTGMAAMYSNLGQKEEAARYFREALRWVDRMTEREKFRTFGLYYLGNEDFTKAVENFEALVEKYPADQVGQANLAYAYFGKRQFQAAVEQQQKIVAVNASPAFRHNLALYAVYAGDFDLALSEAQAVLAVEPGDIPAHLSRALAYSGQGNVRAARNSYQELQGVSALGVSFANVGLADLAHYEGNHAEAARLLNQGILGDSAAGNTAFTARKLVMLARVQAEQGQAAEAVASLQRTLGLSQGTAVLCTAGEVYAALGEDREARAVVAQLKEQTAANPNLCAALIGGYVALNKGNAQQALSHFEAAQVVADTWLGRLALGRAQLELGSYAEAEQNFEICLERTGEALALFLDDLTTFSYLPQVHYYLGQARTALQKPEATASFETYINIKKNADSDPLLAKAHAAVSSR